MFKVPFQVMGIDPENNTIVVSFFAQSPPMNTYLPIDLYPFAKLGPALTQSNPNGNVTLKCSFMDILDPVGLQDLIDTHFVWNTYNEDPETTIQKSHDGEVEQAIWYIVNELRAAEKKFPTWKKDAVYAAGILTEEAGETLQAALNFQLNPTDDIGLRTEIMKESIQTGAMAIRVLLNLEGYEHESCRISSEQIHALLSSGRTPKEIVAELRKVYH